MRYSLRWRWCGRLSAGTAFCAIIAAVDAQLVLIIVGAACAGFVQGLSGFGFSLVSLSFWAWALAPKLAAVLAVFGGLSGQLLAAFSVRRGFDARRVLPFIAGGLVGLPLGLWLLPRVDTVMFRAGVGALLAFWCPAMLFSARLPPAAGPASRPRTTAPPG